MRNWTGFVPGTEDAILPAESIMDLLSTPRHSAKLKDDYISSAAGYTPIFLKKLKEVTKASEFWKPKA